MKVILTIGRSAWLCDSAAVAARISDALGGCEPVQRIWDCGNEPEIYHQRRDHGHKVEIEEVTSAMLITPSIAKIGELRKKYLAGETEDASPTKTKM